MKQNIKRVFIIFLSLVILMTSNVSMVFADESYLQQGQAYMDAGKYEEAIKIFDLMIKQHIDEQQAYFKGAECLYQLGDYSKSLAYCEIGILMDPSKAPASIYLLKGMGLIQYKNYLSALKAMIVASEKEPKNAEIQLVKGTSLYGLKRFDEALTCFNLAIANDPTEPAYYIAKAGTLSILSREDEAIATIDDALKLDKAKESDEAMATLYFTKGKSLYNQENYKDALDEFINAADYKEFVDNGLYVGKTLSFLGEFQKAENIFDLLIENNPDNSYVYSSYGILLNNMRSYDKALVYFDKAIQLEPDNYEAYINKGLSLVYMGKYKDSVLFIDKAIQLYPTLIQAYIYKGYAYYKQMQYDQAIKAYDEAIKNKAVNKVIYSEKGYVLIEMNRFAEAIQYFDKSLALDKNFDQALNGKAYALSGIKKYSEALTLTESIIKENPKVAYTYVSKGKALTGLKKYKEAIGALDNAIKLNPKLTVAYYEKGNVYLVQADYENAIKNYEKAMALEPMNRKYLDARKAAVDALAKKNNGLSLKTSTVINIGKTEKLAVSGGSPKIQLTWTSSNPKIAAVDKYGTVTAVSQGETTIYAISSDKKIKMYCRVNVVR